MTKEEMEIQKDLNNRCRVQNYINGTYISNKYTKEELEEKRKYYENCYDIVKNEMTKVEWLGKIVRAFENDKYINEYPDCAFGFLELTIFNAKIQKKYSLIKNF